MSEDRYVPAAGFRIFQSLYDPIVAVTMREDKFRGNFIDQIFDGESPAGLDIADVGAGTGTVSIALARSGARVIGIDGDPAALATARSKDGAGLVDFREGMADGLPLEDDSVDVVAMSLLLHHLSPDAKKRALREAHRVLRPGGKIHIADWGKPGDPAMRTASFVLQVIDGFDNTRDLVGGRLKDLLLADGFAHVTIHSSLRTGFGRVEMVSASPV